MFNLFNKNPKDGNVKNARRGIIKGKRRDKTLSHPAFKLLVLLNVAGAIVAGYLYFNQEKQQLPTISEIEGSYSTETSTPFNRQVSNIRGRQTREKREKTATTNFPVLRKETLASKPKVAEKAVTPPAVTAAPAVTVPVPVTKRIDPVAARVQKPATTQLMDKVPVPQEKIEAEQSNARINENITYTVAGPQVYFHNKPDERTRRNAFINRWNKAVLKPLNEENGFVYIVYTNQWGQTSKGWMLKKHLKPLN